LYSSSFAGSRHIAVGDAERDAATQNSGLFTGACAAQDVLLGSGLRRKVRFARAAAGRWSRGAV
jgi:hypothetical protein